MFFFSAFSVVYLLGEVVMSLINDKSHFTKTLLLIGQFLNFAAGVLVMLGGKGYFAEQRTHIGLHEIQEQGISLE